MGGIFAYGRAAAERGGRRSAGGASETGAERRGTAGGGGSLGKDMLDTLRRHSLLRLGAVAAAAFALLAAPAAAQAASQTDKPWIHVRVEGESEDERVAVNVPLAAAGAMADSLGEEIFGELYEEVGEHADEDEIAELRDLWQALRDDPGTSIDISEDGNERLTAVMDGDEVRVEGSGDDGTIFIRVPVAFGDALFAGGDLTELDFAAALETLSGHEGDLVSVEGDDGRVRVWIGPQP